MKTKFLTFREVLFYVATPSPLKSKVKVIEWFLYRLILRILLNYDRMKKRLKRLEDLIILSKMKDGAKLYHTIEELANVYEIYGEEKQFKIDISKFFSSVKHPVLIDVGAHIGIWSIRNALQYKYGIVYSLEPFKRNFEMLRRNIRLNGIKNILPFNFGLAERNTIGRLYLDEYDYGSHSLFKKGNNYEKIMLLTLDEFIRKIKISKINLIKIDTEGAEYKILIGGINTIRKFRPFLIIETHPWYDKHVNEKIIRLLKKLKYNIVMLKDVSPVIFAWHKNINFV